MTPNPTVPGYEDIRKYQKELFDLRLEACKSVSQSDWNMEDLEKVLKSLTNNKARDSHGHCYELFKYGGTSVKKSILRLFNEIKKEGIYPSIMQPSNITSLWKHKGEKADFENQRGIFNVVKLRSIMDKMIMNDIYETVDGFMGPSNIGARKKRSCRDHVLVVNSIINEAVNNKTIELDINVYDVSKCFDKMDYKATAVDMYDAGVRDSNFVVMAIANESADVAVKTPWGSLTERKRINDLEMQGTVCAPLKCSVQTGAVGETALMSELGYKYRGCVSIPPLSFIDDILTVTNCTIKSTKMNAIVQAHINSRHLKFGITKCFRMHVGAHRMGCSINKVQSGKILEKEKVKY